MLFRSRAQVPELRVVHAPGRGRGADAGATRAQGRILWIIDPDVAMATLAPVGPAVHDILAGTMHLPWLQPGVVDEITRVDGYMKMLYQGRRQRPIQGFLRKIGGKMAEARLRTRFFGMPVDLAAHGWFHRQAILRNLKANKISLAGIASPAEA